MTAIVVREQGTNKLIQFGPNDGNYKPGPVPNSYIRVEDYAKVYAEDRATQPPPRDREAAILESSRVPQWYKDLLTDDL